MYLVTKSVFAAVSLAFGAILTKILFQLEGE
jgi:hypothetical protein